MSWADVPFDASNFTTEGAPGTASAWTVVSGNQSVFRYFMLDPDTMILDYSLWETSVSGTPYSLCIKIPDGRKGDVGTMVPFSWFQNVYGIQGIGRSQVARPGDDHIKLSKQPGKPIDHWFPLNGTYVFGQTILKLQPK